VQARNCGRVFWYATLHLGGRHRQRSASCSAGASLPPSKSYFCRTKLVGECSRFRFEQPSAADVGLRRFQDLQRMPRGSFRDRCRCTEFSLP
jgi:hypothetical protein